jgi:proteasome lid subunit RPN8/RPN11
MTLHISPALLGQLHAHLEEAFPGEGAGFLFGSEQNSIRRVSAILKLPNSREESARHNRFLLSARDYLQAELEAERLGLEVLGVFHSHPDCPNRPSEYDREWAMPWFSYIITRVDGQDGAGKAVSDLSWRLEDDRAGYSPEEIALSE